MVLNTGWKKWDKFLSKFVDKKINCLDIGSYEGASTCWMLNNLCTNPESKVYSIDTWEGSPEYGEMDFSKIEKTFDENVIKTGKKSQHIKMKMSSMDGLIKLKMDKIMFDLIFIDASHEAIDVMTDGILAWNILKQNSILIFDDYKWDKLKEDFFKPKLAIDSFVSIFASQLNTLYIGYQYFVEKKNYSDFIKPELENVYNLMSEIDSIKQCELFFEISLKNYDKLKFNLILKQEKPQYILNDTFEKYKKVLEKDNFEMNDKYFNYDLNRLLLYYKENTLENSLPEKLHKKILESGVNPFIKFYESYQKTKQNLENPVFEIISQLNKLNLIKNDNVFLNFSHSKDHIPDKIRVFIEEILNLNLRYEEIIYEDNNLLNINEIKNTVLTKKYDIINISLTNVQFIQNKRIDYEINYTIQLFYSILFCFLNLNKNGSFVSICFGFNNEVNIQLLWIIKKYFENIILTCYNSNKIITSTTKIIATNFKGISKEELNEFIEIGEKITKYNSSYKNENLYYIHNLLKINNDDKYYKIFVEKIKKFNEKKLQLLTKNLLIWQKIIDFFENNNNENNRNKIKNYIYTKQLQNALWWINKYGI
jgi:predicted O-methyltransferase YrrM